MAKKVVAKRKKVKPFSSGPLDGLVSDVIAAADALLTANAALNEAEDNLNTAASVYANNRTLANADDLLTANATRNTARTAYTTAQSNYRTARAALFSYLDGLGLTGIP